MKTARIVGLWAALCIPCSLPAEVLEYTTIVFHSDSRSEALRSFFQRVHSPLAPLAPDFVLAADRYGLDWRLLPSIAMVESSGGKHYKNRNIFGWNSGRARFRSIRGSIHYVASRLARSRLYSGKNVVAVLRTYNPVRPEYPERVMRFMRNLPPDAPTLAAALSKGAHPLWRAMSNPSADVREAGFHGGLWRAGPAAVPSRRAMPGETPVRLS